ncbi:MAG: Holliday junction branch migration protein RuvA, partial [Candidatus Lambdaproteobacteria bacterium]|nr:Holliday junction branch migration protein RuvA [Candidatus Lambdaproteobacteria bacterium]
MIGFIEGALGAIRGNRAIVHTPGGVGYELALPLSVLAEISGRKTVALHVVTVVKDDAIDLYGFDTAEAKALFERLIGVSGIGPKAALAMLSTFSPERLEGAIVAQDVALISTVPGIGKKTATRLCVELSDRLARHAVQQGTVSGGRGDLISALTNLGFPE